MEMRNCRRCGKVFMYTGVPICTACIQQDEEDFKLVKSYIYDHPKCSIAEVAEETKVSIKKITKFLREGRLEIVEGMNIFLECESCGAAIKSGRFCQNCSQDLENHISSAAAPEKPKIEVTKDGKRAKMYTADRF